jgi:predicted HicB family RNase H-like nuclease
MKEKLITQTKNRMIHIRLDNKTHRRLKIKAVKEDTTVQKLVEDLILESIVTPRAKDARE